MPVRNAGQFEVGVLSGMRASGADGGVGAGRLCRLRNGTPAGNEILSQVRSETGGCGSSANFAGGQVEEYGREYV